MPPMKAVCSESDSRTENWFVPFVKVVAYPKLELELLLANIVAVGVTSAVPDVQITAQ